MKKEIKEIKEIIVVFSLGHLYPTDRETIKIPKNEIIYWGRRYLGGKLFKGGEAGERAKEMLFPYFYITPP